jgi:hypothetical protein
MKCLPDILACEESLEWLVKSKNNIYIYIYIYINNSN